MGHCISDSNVKDEFFEVKKQFNDDKFDQDEQEFCQKQLNDNVKYQIENNKRIAFSDGLGKQDNSRSIITISY